MFWRKFNVTILLRACLVGWNFYVASSTAKRPLDFQNRVMLNPKQSNVWQRIQNWYKTKPIILNCRSILERSPEGNNRRKAEKKKRAMKDDSKQRNIRLWRIVKWLTLEILPIRTVMAIYLLRRKRSFRRHFQSQLQ